MHIYAMIKKKISEVAGSAVTVKMDSPDKRKGHNEKVILF